MSTPLLSDVDLHGRDVQDLADADALASFLARLGYDTNARTVQTPGNLGITADGTLRPIRKIELLADREGALQVYLFEVQSVTSNCRSEHSTRAGRSSQIRPPPAPPKP